MSSQFRNCQNCGATLAPGETQCPRCGVPYVDQMIQKPGEFEPFPPDQQMLPGRRNHMKFSHNNLSFCLHRNNKRLILPKARDMCSHLHLHHMVQVDITSRHQARLEYHLKPQSQIPGKG